MIMAEGVDSLTIPELQHACQSRGIRTIGVSPARLRSELNQWLDLHLNHKVPSTLLILSRAFSFADRNELANQAEALQATLSSLPDNLVNKIYNFFFHSINMKFIDINLIYRLMKLNCKFQKQMVQLHTSKNLKLLRSK